jgi:hypothetical protein
VGAGEAADLLIDTRQYGGREWCKCDKCIFLYEQRGLSFMFKEDLDRDFSGLCLVMDTNDSDDEDQTATSGDDGQTSGDDDTRRRQRQQQLQNLDPAQSASVVAGIRQMTESWAGWVSTVPKGHVITAKDVQQFFDGFNKERKRKREEGE